MEPGKFYLFASPFFWTTVGRFVRPVDLHDLEIADAIYFTRPGATFDILCSQGLQSNSKTHGPFKTLFIPRQGLKFPWDAETPWIKRVGKK